MSESTPSVIVALFMTGVIMFFIGACFGEASKHKQWCRATNTELAKFDECVKREKP